MNEPDLEKFTCKECGSHRLTVTHVWNVLAGEDSQRWREWGPLKASHHWQYEFKEQDEEKPDAEVQRGDYSEFQPDDSDSEPEEYEIFEPETDREGDEFFVNCDNCDREIEFGWSEPDQRGLIFPIEFSDFNPTESWPDPKYWDTWQKRGWVRK